jgi:hypothetical protein
MKPPSVHSTCPTTNEAASDASQTTASATSSGRPMRRSDSPAAPVPMSMIFDPSIMSVTTRPGATALMRTPFSAYSMAADRVNEISAAFEAE